MESLRSKRPATLRSRLTLPDGPDGRRLELVIPGPGFGVQDLLVALMAICLSVVVFLATAPDMVNAPTLPAKLLTASAPMVLVAVPVLRRHGKWAHIVLGPETLTVVTTFFGFAPRPPVSLGLRDLEVVTLAEARGGRLIVVVRTRLAWAQFGGTLPGPEVQYLFAEIRSRVAAVRPDVAA